MRTLVIAAHPDDEILGVGGTILKRIDDGHKVYILIVCDCLSPRNSIKTRDKVGDIASEVSRRLGVSKFFHIRLGSNTGQRLDELPFKEVISKIESVIDEVKPHEVFTHNPNDWNTDHQVLFNATISATRTLYKKYPQRIHCYEVPSSTEQAPNLKDYYFVPNKFVDIEKYLKYKIDLFGLYETESFSYPHPRSPEFIEITAKSWGAKNGLNAAEAFMTIRDIER